MLSSSKLQNSIENLENHIKFFVIFSFFVFSVVLCRGSDESRCQVKMSGDMMLSFPAGVVGVFTNNPNPAQLSFRIKNMQNLENLLPNKQLVTM